jgi:hypothetical protein
MDADAAVLSSSAIKHADLWRHNALFAHRDGDPDAPPAADLPPPPGSPPPARDASAGAADVRRTPRNLAADHEAQAVAGRFTSQIALATHAAHQAANFNKLARKLANERARNANGTAKRTEADALQRTADDLSRKNAELNEQAMASADKVDELKGLLHRANADNRAQGSKSKATHETRRLESEYQREVCVCAPADVTLPLRLPPRPLLVDHHRYHSTALFRLLLVVVFHMFIFVSVLVVISARHDPLTHPFFVLAGCSPGKAGQRKPTSAVV